MGRPQTISTERLLEVAREVFCEFGYSATTAQIARRAGISEGTLFKRFASKEALFSAAIGLDELPRWWQRLRGQAGQGEVRANLEDICTRFLELARGLMPRLMLVWSRGTQPPPKLACEHDPHEQALEALAAYLRAEVQLGRVRPLEETVMARALLGALVTHIIREIHAAPDGPPDDARFVADLLDAFWYGLQPQDAPPGTPPDTPRLDQKMDAP